MKEQQKKNLQNQKQSENQTYIHLLKMKVCSLSLSRDQNSIENNNIQQTQKKLKLQKIFKQEFAGCLQTKILNQNLQSKTKTNDFFYNDNDNCTKVFNDKINFTLYCGRNIEIENNSVVIQSTGKEFLSIQVFLYLGQQNQQQQQNNLHFLLKFPLRQFYAIPYVSHSVQANFKLLNKSIVSKQYKNLILNGQFQLQYVLEQWGRLKISRVTAQNLTNTQMFGQIDPYFIITNGVEAQTIKSKIKQNSGQNSTWDQDFFLNVSHKTKVIKIEVFDKDQIYDDKIGQTEIDLLDSGMLVQTVKSSLKKQVFLKTTQKKDAGALTFEYKFQPSRPKYEFKFQRQGSSEWHDEQQLNNTFLSLFNIQNNPLTNLIRSAGNKISQTI